jgi:TRAP-type C4-dicarboxylate transport system permease small subunit
MRHAFVRVEAACQKLFGVAVITVFASIVIVGGLQVFNRFVLNMSLSWSEEFQRFGQAWLVFLGVPLAYSKAMNIGSAFFVQNLPKIIRKVLVILIDLTWLTIGAVLIVTGIRIVRVNANQLSAGMDISMAIVYSVVIVSGVYIALIAVTRLITKPGEDGEQLESEQW